MNTTAKDAEIKRLLEAAERAAAAGRKEEAERFVAQAQSFVPGHSLVLSPAGIRAFETAMPELRGNYSNVQSSSNPKRRCCG